jgi:hypothetical protein
MPLKRPNIAQYSTTLHMIRMLKKSLQNDFGANTGGVALSDQ